MGQMHEPVTPRQLCKMTSTDEDTMRMRFAKLRKTNPGLFPSPWRINGELNSAQITALIQAGERKGGAPKEIDIETESEAVAHSANIAEPAQGPSNEVAPQGFDYEKAQSYANWAVLMERYKVRQDQKNSIAATKPRRWPLWAALAITAGASVPNMVEITTAMKSSGLVAWALTGVFTLIPGLFIAARLRGLLWGFVVVGVMGYTAFCNASAIFGGLTALDHGYILKPTVFLEAVTNMLNTDYINTARALSASMALLIGAIEYVAFKNLSK